MPQSRSDGRGFVAASAEDERQQGHDHPLHKAVTIQQILNSCPSEDLFDDLLVMNGLYVH
jgi:hypothetical protein